MNHIELATCDKLTCKEIELLIKERIKDVLVRVSTHAKGMIIETELDGFAAYPVSIDLIQANKAFIIDVFCTAIKEEYKKSMCR